MDVQAEILKSRIEKPSAEFSSPAASPSQQATVPDYSSLVLPPTEQSVKHDRIKKLLRLYRYADTKPEEGIGYFTALRRCEPHVILFTKLINDKERLLLLYGEKHGKNFFAGKIDIDLLKNFELIGYEGVLFSTPEINKSTPKKRNAIREFWNRKNEGRPFIVPISSFKGYLYGLSRALQNLVNDNSAISNTVRIIQDAKLVRELVRQAKSSGDSDYLYRNDNTIKFGNENVAIRTLEKSYINFADRLCLGKDILARARECLSKPSVYESLYSQIAVPLEPKHSISHSIALLQWGLLQMMPAIIPLAVVATPIVLMPFAAKQQLASIVASSIAISLATMIATYASLELPAALVATKRNIPLSIRNIARRFGFGTMVSRNLDMAENMRSAIEENKDLTLFAIVCGAAHTESLSDHWPGIAHLLEIEGWERHSSPDTALSKLQKL